MNGVTQEELDTRLRAARISKRLVRDLRYIPEHITHPNERDFLVVTTKSGNEGVLLFGEWTAPFELKRRSQNAAGRVEAVICDICATWQRGTNSAQLILKAGNNRSVTYLVCGDLDCSLHVRGLTAAATLSRSQLREQITPEERIARLCQRLEGMLVFVYAS